MVDYVTGLGEAELAVRADIKSFMRADEIQDIDMAALQLTPDHFHAQVVGTKPYLVSFELAEENSLHVSCSCPVPREWCKHAVAVASRMMFEPQWALNAPAGQEIPQLDPAADPSMPKMVDAAVERMPRSALVEMVKELRRLHPSIEPSVTTLAIPEWYGKPGPTTEVRDAIERVRGYAAEYETPGEVHRAVTAFDRFVNVAESTANKKTGLAQLRVLELMIFELDAYSRKALYPSHDFGRVAARMCALHARLAAMVKLPACDVIEWLLDIYFLDDTYIPFRMLDYAELLSEEDLEQLLKAAYERVPRKPKLVTELECYVAYILEQPDDLKYYSLALPCQDSLFSAYEQWGMFGDAEELTRRALDPADEVELSASLRLEAAKKYFDEAGPRMFFAHAFRTDPSLEAFRYFAATEGTTFTDGIKLLDEHFGDTHDANYDMLAAICFNQLAYGLNFIDHEDLSSSLIDEFAEKVLVHADPEWATQLMFGAVAEVIATGLHSHQPDMIHDAGARVLAIRTMIEEDQNALIEWHMQLAALKERFHRSPEVAEALAEWGL